LTQLIGKRPKTSRDTDLIIFYVKAKPKKKILFNCRQLENFLHALLSHLV